MELITTKTKNGDLLSPLWSELLNGERFFSSRWPMIEPVFLSPPANVIETGSSFKIELAVPGFSKEDFNVEVEDNVLSINAEKEEEMKEKEDRYTRKEFTYTSFSRSFTLPSNCEDAEIKAEYNDGILKLVIPKKKIAGDSPKKAIAVK